MGTGLFDCPGSSANARKMSHREAHAIGKFRGINNKCQLASMAGFLRVSEKPLPPLSEYERWLSTHCKSRLVGGRHKQIDGRKLKRTAQMRRNACTFREIGTATGLSGECVFRWFHMLPLELR